MLLILPFNLGPDLPPQDIEGIPTSPSTMGIVWKPVPFPFGRGIILGYRFVLSTMSGEILVDKILGLDKDFISVGDLELFTNYTLNMTAFTIKGEGPWASKVVLSLQIGRLKFQLENDRFTSACYRIRRLAYSSQSSARPKVISS